ncbi:hypothetical protein DUI87_18620 [Hirundo rustica rustica]|uniref:Uncharacterized protein n=1 Tax=Hirundo rustica rustica TaxID=333673 RepID=A0A3M0JXE0_HIRRU|nr:hypothetical protein DUI87_18620 [Hirundo rustica rustica]
MDIRNNFFMERVAKFWNGLLRQVVRSSPGAVQETTGSSTFCHGLIDKVRIGRRSMSPVPATEVSCYLRKPANPNPLKELSLSTFKSGKYSAMYSHSTFYRKAGTEENSGSFEYLVGDSNQELETLHKQESKMHDSDVKLLQPEQIQPSAAKAEKNKLLPTKPLAYS